MLPPRAHRALLLLASAALGCGAGAAVGDAAADGSPTPSARVTVVSASLGESDNPTADQLRLELAVASVGTAAIDAVTVTNSRLTLDSFTIAVDLSSGAPGRYPPVVPGETRSFVYQAELPPVALCTRVLRMQPNPHRGLASLGLTVLTSGGGLVVTGLEVEVVCPPLPDPVLACGATLEQVCSAGGTTMFQLDCAPTWTDVVLDRRYCGTTLLEQTADCDGYQARFVVGDDISAFTYYYDRSSGALVAATYTDPNGAASCVAGPADGFLVPPCPTRQSLQHCDVMTTDGGTPLPDGGVRERPGGG